VVLPMPRPTSRPDSRFPQARKVVPLEVRAILGRVEFKKAIRATDPATIKRLHREALTVWEAEIEAARAKLGGKVRSLTAREISVACGIWYRDELTEWDANSTDNDWDLTLSLLDDDAEMHGGGGAGPKWLSEAESVLRSQGIAADADTIARMAVALFDAKVLLARSMERRSHGDWRPDPYVERFAAPPAAPVPAVEPAAAQGPAPLPFADLLASWAAERQPTESTRAKYAHTLAGLAGVMGHDDARRVTPSDVRHYKEARLGAGMSPKTVKNGVEAIGTVLTWGITNAFLDGTNPAARMAPKMGRGGVRVRGPYSEDDAAAILKAARLEKGWRRWLPWMLAFTGARVGELADLQCRDVREVAGVMVIAVEATAARRIKTENAQRLIPVHPALVAEGFLTYARSLPAGGPLFPDITPDSAGQRTPYAQAKHGLWVRDVVGINDPRKAPAHAWRHRLRDALLRVRAPDEAIDAILGHNNPRNAGAGYGRGYRGMPDETAKELCKVVSPVPPPT